MKSNETEVRGILYGISIFLIFASFFLLCLGGLFLYRAEGDFYSAFRLRLEGMDYWSALGILAFTALLYTPVSYGLSHYFILANRGEARFSAIFFLFRRPRILMRAIGISVLKKILVYGERLLLLLTAAMAEVALFFAFLLFSGENIFGVKGNPFTLAAEFMMGSPWLIGLSVALWCGVFLGFLLVNLRYILCKYVLLCYEEVNVLEATRIGRHSLKKNWFSVLRFYLLYGARCVLTAITLGFYPFPKKKNFSAYACELVQKGFGDYCCRRSNRSHSDS